MDGLPAVTWGDRLPSSWGEMGMGNQEFPRGYETFLAILQEPPYNRREEGDEFLIFSADRMILGEEVEAADSTLLERVTTAASDVIGTALSPLFGWAVRTVFNNINYR